MDEINVQLVITLLAILCTGLSLVPALPFNKEVNANSKLAGHWRLVPKEQLHRKRQSGLPHVNIISGKTKEWTNVERSWPMKRSDNNLTDALFKKTPLLTNECISDNMGNSSKFPCPINLLYGNNLTVKNFFLMMPEGNVSYEDHSQIEKHLDVDKNGKLSNLENTASQSGIGNFEKISAIALNGTDNFSTSEVITSIVQEASNGLQNASMITESTIAQITSSQIDNSLTPEVGSNIGISSSLATGNTPSDVVLNNTNNLEGYVCTYYNFSLPQNTAAVEEVSRPSTIDVNVSVDNSGVSSMSLDVSADNLNTYSLASFNVTSSAIVDNVNNLPSITEHQDIGLSTQGVTTNSPESVSVINLDNQTIPGLRADILRTIDKYCETLNFNLSNDNGNYSINPVQIPQQLRLHRQNNNFNE